MPARPFIPAPNAASVEMIYLFVGEYYENVFHVRKGSPYSLADLQALRALIISWDNVTYKVRRTGQSTLIRVRTKALDSGSSPMEDYALPVPQAGTGGGAPQPLNVAYCIKLATGLAGRSQRGRFYAGGIVAGDIQDSGHVTAAAQTAYQAALTTLLNNLATAGHTLVVASYMTGGAWRSVAQLTPVTTIVAVDTNLDSQRRRLPGRGHSI